MSMFPPKPVKRTQPPLSTRTLVLLYGSLGSGLAIGWFSFMASENVYVAWGAGVPAAGLALAALNNLVE